MFLAAEVPDALVGLVLTLLGLFIVAVFSIGIAMLVRLTRIEGKLDNGHERMDRLEKHQEALVTRVDRHSRKLTELGAGRSRPDLNTTN